MDGNARSQLICRQRGAVLLLLLLIIIVGGITVFTVSQDSGGIERAKHAHDRDVLLQAKEAVIAYAAYRHDPNGDPPPNNVRPGELLCPDKDYDGKSTGGPEGCGNQCCTYRGWLPYETLEMKAAQDSTGARLWYAVTDAYQTFAQYPDTPLNSATPGALGLDGNEVVAVIIAPGEPLCFQTSRASVFDSPDAVSASDQFLDYKNSNGDPTLPDEPDASEYFTRSNNDMSAPCGNGAEYANDLVIGITAEEIWRQAVGWPLQQAKESLDSFYGDDFDGDGNPDNRLPYPRNNDGDCRSVAYPDDEALYSGLLPIDNDGDCDGDDAISDSPAWFVGNRWDALIYYIVSGDCVSPDSCGSPGGTLTLDADGVDALVVDAGAELTGTACGNSNVMDHAQDRAGGSTICDYLDLVENTNTNDDSIFVQPAATDFSNDRFIPLDY